MNTSPEELMELWRESEDAYADWDEARHQGDSSAVLFMGLAALRSEALMDRIIKGMEVEA